jgi:hypothetical protein
MKPHPSSQPHPRCRSLLAAAFGLLVLASTPVVHAQYVSSVPARPFPGYINEKLRTDPYMGAWDIGVNVRLRVEDKENAGFGYTGSNADFRYHGTALNSDNNNSYNLSRIMPRVGYTDKWWSFLAEFRSSASYGDERGAVRVAADATKPGNALAENDRDANVHQLYVTIGNHKEFPLSLKLGRQELVYGDQRLLGHFRWNNNARTFDAVKFRWQNAWFGMDAFTGGIVYNDNDNFNKSHIGDDSFSGLYFNFPNLPVVSEKNIVETYLFARNVERSSALVDVTGTTPYAGVAAPFRNPAKQDLYTAGIRVKSKPLAYGGWDYGVELMHQFGNRATTGPTATSAATAAGVRLKQDAYAAVLAAGYTWTESAWQHRIGFTYSYASGDKNSTDGKSQTFQNLFATTHLFYGFMDLSSLQNLQDLRLTYSFKPMTNMTIALDAHLQHLDQTTDSWYNVAGVARGGGAPNAGTGYAISPAFSNELGTEIDLVISWHVIPSTQIELGVSHYFRGDYIKQSFSSPAIGSKDADYIYFQTTISF